MSRQQVLYTFILLLICDSQVCSSDTDLPPVLECGPNVQVNCNIIETANHARNSAWTPGFCFKKASNNTEIAFKYSKPPRHLEDVEKFEIRINMRNEMIVDERVKNTNTQTKCRYSNLKPAKYRVYVRPVPPNIFRSPEVVARVAYISLQQFEDPNMTKDSRGVTKINPSTIKPQNIVPTITKADSSTESKFHTKTTASHVATIIFDKFNTKSNTTTFAHGSKFVVPGFSDISTTKDIGFNVSVINSTKVIVPYDPGLSLVIVVLIVMVTVMSLFLAGICWRKIIHGSICQRENFKLCSNNIIVNVCDTRKSSSEQSTCQENSTTVCEESFVSLTESQQNEQNNSGFDSNRDSAGSNVVTYTEDILKHGENLINNGDSLCDISDGNFVANVQVWADMDRDLSPSLCTIASLTCDNKGINRCLRRGESVRYPRKREYNKDWLSEHLERNTIEQIPLCNGYYSPLKVIYKNEKDFQNESPIPERAKLLSSVVDDDRYNYPMFLSHCHVESAETLNLSLSGAMGGVKNKPLNHLAKTHGVNTYCHSVFKGAKQPVYTLNDDVTDIISFGQISI